MEASDEDNDLVNAYRRLMEIVEETLSKLKGTVCSWPKPANFDLTYLFTAQYTTMESVIILLLHLIL